MNENINNSSSELPNEVKLNSESDSNPIFDIISTLQSKLSDKTTTTNENSNNNDTAKAKDVFNKTEKGFDISKLNSIINSLNSNTESTTASSQNNSTEVLSSLAGLNIDMSTITRFQKIFSKLNQDDPRKNFLNSLKPFLRETRQKNLDTYIILIALADAFDIFGKKETGGE